MSADGSTVSGPAGLAVGSGLSRASATPARSGDTVTAPDEDVLAQAREIADFLKALGHEGRWLMLQSLSEGEMSVTELEQRLHSRQAAVSQQLARLRYEKLVETRREGNQIIYSLADDRVREVVDLMQRLFGSR